MRRKDKKRSRKSFKLWVEAYFFPFLIKRQEQAAVRAVSIQNRSLKRRKKHPCRIAHLRRLRNIEEEHNLNIRLWFFKQSAPCAESRI